MIDVPTPAKAKQMLAATAWDAKRPALTYREWISYANYHPDQDFTWREHERLARLNYTELGTWDMGGEA